MRFGLALLGFVIGGPIGAIIGYFLGVFIEKSQIDIRRQAEQSTQNAFFLALSGLAAEVIKADGVVSKAEVLFAKEFFIREFGPATADRMMKRLKIFVSERVPVEQICRQSNRCGSSYLDSPYCSSDFHSDSDTFHGCGFFHGRQADTRYAILVDTIERVFHNSGQNVLHEFLQSDHG